MHKFAVIHKPSGIVCYSTNREIRNFEPGFNYEIVNNSNEYKTINPDLTFNSYAEIANALDLSDKLTFSKGDDDVLTIADNTRSVSIPSLLFEELLIEVEEVAMGDVEELLEDYSFNRDCTELLARNAIKFFTAARFLELSQETNADNADTTEGEEMTETTTESKEITTDPVSNNFTIITPDLTFNSYSEIADALELSDMLVFTKDENDTLTISDNARSVTIPALLFNEVCLNIEDVVIGDVYEIIEDFGFNHECTELLARQSIKFWTASRFLDTTETTESKEMNNVFKKAITLPIVINFTHSVSKSHEYYGCPRITAECQALNFKGVVVGYGYDMVGALMSDFINAECTQYAVQSSYAFNELRDDSYNPIRYNSKTDVFSVNLCVPDVKQFFEDVGLDCKLVNKKNGQIITCVISSK